MNPLIPKPAAYLLAFIYETETGKTAPDCYGVIYGQRQTALAKPLTSMTLAEVQAAQGTWSTKAWAKRFKSDKASSAAGAPQLMRATLKDLIQELGLSTGQRLDANMQDRLAFHLLKRRGYEQFIAGRIGATEFARRLAQEWASFPVLASTAGAHRTVTRGQSYYEGDALNKALVKPAQIEAVLRAVKALASEPEAAPIEPPVRQPDDPGVEPDEAPETKSLSHSKRFWTWITTGGGTALIPFIDWRVQVIVAVAIVCIAAYAIVTMPAFRKKLGLS